MGGTDYKELIVEFKKGDYSRFSSFYDEIKNPVFYNIYSLTHDKDLSEELLQETFTKFLMNIKNVDESENIVGFLILISRNITLDYFKKHGRVRGFMEHEEVHHHDEQDIDKILLLDKISQILNEKELEIFTLHVLSELTFEEISKIKGKALGTILWSYNNSIKKIRKNLENVWKRLMIRTY